MQRLRVLAVVGDEEHRSAIGRHLAERVEQAGTEAGVEGADDLAGPHRPGGDAPVAGDGVMYGVVEACGRDLAVFARQLFAQGVAVVPVGARGGEHRGQRGRVAACMGRGFEAEGEA